jgi:hypothetical protein
MKMSNDIIVELKIFKFICTDYYVMKIQEFAISPAELKYDHQHVILEAGYPNLESAPYFVDAINNLHNQLLPMLSIRAGFRVFEGIKMKPDAVQLAHHTFHVGKIIGTGLRNTSNAYIFVCTVGEGFEEFLKPLFDQSPAEGYLVDLLGSMIVEAAADFIEDKIIAHTAQNYGFPCTNRYSPGYCDWHVSEQQYLFDLLPENFCGISLSESSLMHPRKSVSGLIGMGQSVQKKNYSCTICQAEHCFRRKSNTTNC